MKWVICLCGVITTVLLSGCGPRQEVLLTARIKVVQLSDGSFEQAVPSNLILNGPACLYYPSGRVHALLRFERDSLEGRQIWFHPAGYLESIEYRHRGRLDGRKYIFDANGSLESARIMRNGLRVGNYHEYYAHPRNRLHIRAQFVAVQGREWDNGYTEYDTSGHVKSGRGFLLLHANYDTLSLGQTLTLRLRVAFPKEKYTLASIYGYDSLYQLARPKEQLIIPGNESHSVTVNVQTVRRGAAEVRGYVSDYKAAKPVNNMRSDDDLEVKERRMYFAYPYYVR